jgi:hypothetical protein
MRLSRTALVTRTRVPKVTCKSPGSPVIPAIFRVISEPNARNQPWPPKSAAVRAEKSAAAGPQADELDATPPGTPLGARFSGRLPSAPP